MIFRIVRRAGAYDRVMGLGNFTRYFALRSSVFAVSCIAVSVSVAACSRVTPPSVPAEAAVPAPSGLAPVTHSDFVGPSALDMRPGPEPLDLSARTFAADVERDKLEKDVAMIWRVRSLLPPAASTASDFLHTLGVEKAKDAVDFGFGLQLSSAELEGGYATCGFALASHDDALVGLKVLCSARVPRAEEAVVHATLTEALGPAFSSEPMPVFYAASADYRSASASATLRAVLDQALAPLEPIAEDTMTPELGAAYERLMSPVEPLVVGYHCGIGGSTPPGAAAEFTLQAAKRVDLLRNVLRGPNPGGRMYAFRALTRLKALRPEDEALLKTLSATKTPVQTCHGCMFSTETTAYVLEEQFF